MITPGLVSVTFRQLPPERIVTLAAEAGLASIEWGGDVHVPHGDVSRARDVRRFTADAGLMISAYGSYYRAGVSQGQGLSFGPVVETAAELGAPVVRVWAGVAGSRESDDASRRAVADDLARVCDDASRLKLGIALEFHADTLTDTAESALALIREVDKPNLTSFWQPPNGMATVEALRGLQLLLRHVRNLHVFHWWPDRHHRLALADGVDRWRRYLAAAGAAAGEAAREARHASLEFVVGDDVDAFRRDAAILLRLVSEGARP
jgi:sugar phosphate isomerase/epimerase